ncbi:Vegetative incompatibility protein HET-E-1 [Cyphellophora attinorum]|uniref:Vegetative incompatibility protein HET-E-1 n=1 Tax=Cyphellophora attinorum TaxID=1664694 RepID=A0A0N0NME3_9EURO|nr:Vegetative incompatibility protein HET-E-1 [Phialophora attinorum]KPI40361.1 Vegetative incompatibility protein HET-E-1 [Phialophora attinorum]
MAIMRLLHVDDSGNIKLTQHDPRSPPPYAILSHTWSENDGDEVLYEDVQTDAWKRKKARYKIDFCAAQVKKDGLEYFWLDTCCINKGTDRNGTEVEAAITSMFRWYAASVKCYVLLCDVSSNKRNAEGLCDLRSSNFNKARWFTRGWTLQELLAPSCVEFFSREGGLIGTRASLKREIHRATGIPLTALDGAKLASFSIDERRQWAVFRKTKEPEDMAYCLAGLFNVYLKPHYGEDLENAWHRLQDEIKKRLGRYIDGLEPPVPLVSDEAPSVARGPDRPGTEHGSTAARRSLLLESLAFDDMDVRRDTHRSAHRATCKWLLRHEAFVQWSTSTHDRGDCNFLWIKGDPGVGKSIMMKHIFTDIKRRKSPNDIVVSFFFNAQLLDDIKTDTWTVDSVCEILYAATEKLRDRRLVCFIDALDECDEQEIRDMITFMEDLSMHSVESGTQFSICFASRHYPTIVVRYGSQIVLEDEPGHEEDIIQYVNKELKGGSGSAVQHIKDTILTKSNGVFLWVFLVVRKMNAILAQGRVKEAKKALHDTPEELDELFKQIIERDTVRRGDLLLSLMLIAFARRPLDREEFCHAIETWNEEDPSGLTGLDRDEFTADHMSLYVSSSTKGLAGLTTRKKSTVQFIHESVHDYLVKRNGLIKLWPGEINGDLFAFSHDQIKQCCAKYISSDLTGYVKGDRELPKAKSAEGRLLREKVTKAFPFLNYAVDNLWYHSNNAHADLSPQMAFLRSYPREQWLLAANVVQIHSTRRYSKNTSLLQILAANAAPKLIGLIGALGSPQWAGKYVAKRDRHPVFTAIEADCDEDVIVAITQYCSNFGTVDNGLDITTLAPLHTGNKEHRTALGYAAKKGWMTAVQSLLNAGVDVDHPARDSRTPTALFIACYNNRYQVVQALLSNGADPARTAKFYNVKTRYYLQDAHVLVVASFFGYAGIVRLLLKERDILDDDEIMLDAVQVAADRNHQEILDVLQEAITAVPADFGVTFGCAFTAALVQGNIEDVKILLNDSARQKIGQSHLQQALFDAARFGDVGVMHLLLDKEVDPNSVGFFHYESSGWLERREGFAVAAAIAHLHKEAAQVLVDHGATLEPDKFEFLIDAMLKESRKGNLAALELYLMYVPNNTRCHPGLALKFDIELQGSSSVRWIDVALVEAVNKGHTERVQLLVDGGADLTARHRHWGNVLVNAAYLGHVDIARVLLSAGADVHIRCLTSLAFGGLECTALEAVRYRIKNDATSWDREEILRMLIDAGGDADRRYPPAALSLVLKTRLRSMLGLASLLKLTRAVGLASDDVDLGTAVGTEDITLAADPDLRADFDYSPYFDFRAAADA